MKNQGKVSVAADSRKTLVLLNLLYLIKNSTLCLRSDYAVHVAVINTQLSNMQHT